MSNVIQDKPTVFTFFDAFCPNCIGFDRRLESLRNLSVIPEIQCDLSFVFKASVPTYELTSLKNQSKIDAKFYQINHIIFPEIEYAAQEHLEKHAVSILFAPRGKILYIERFSYSEDKNFENLVKILRRDNPENAESFSYR